MAYTLFGWKMFRLEAYARAQDKKHWPAWVDFNRRVNERRPNGRSLC
jgi:hypothetical protein